MIKHNVWLTGAHYKLSLLWGGTIPAYVSGMQRGTDVAFVGDSPWTAIDYHLMGTTKYGSWVQIWSALSTSVGTYGTLYATTLNRQGDSYWLSDDTTVGGFWQFFSGVRKISNPATTRNEATFGFIDHSDFNDDFKKWWMARLSGSNSATYFGTIRLQSVDLARFYDFAGRYLDATRTYSTFSYGGGAYSEVSSTCTATLVFLATANASQILNVNSAVLYASLSGGPANGYGNNAVATIMFDEKFGELFIDAGQSLEATFIVGF